MNNIIELIRQHGNKAQFVSFTYRARGTGELARHTLILGANYLRQIESSITAMQIMKPVIRGQGPLQRKAWRKVYKSLLLSRKAYLTQTSHPDYTKSEAYIPLGGGLKYCISTNEVNVMGLAHTKVVLEKGEYKKVNHKPLTIETDKIKADLPIKRVREFCINPDNLSVVRMDGETLVLE